MRGRAWLNWWDPGLNIAGPKAPRSRWGPAETVVATAAALVIVIFAVFGFLIWQAYWQTLEQARTRAQAAADIIANETEWIVGGAVATLQQVATIAQTPADVTAETEAAFDRSIANLPAVRSLGLYDATGNAWADAGTASLPGNISGLEAFKTLEAGGEWTITPQIKDAVSGAPIFIVAQRLQGVDGFGGVALLTIDASVLEQLWAPQKPAPTGAQPGARGRHADHPLPADRHGDQPQDQLGGMAADHRQPRRQLHRGVEPRRHHPVGGLPAYPAVQADRFGGDSRDAAVGAIWSSTIIVTWLLAPFALRCWWGRS